MAEDNEKKDMEESPEWQGVTLYDDEFSKVEQTKEKSLQLIVFRLADEWYGVEIRLVKQVVLIEKITYLPSSPSYVAGIINLRGSILAVTDLKDFFGLPAESLSDNSRLVVVESGLLETGLLVDEVLGAIEIEESHIDPTLATIPADRAVFLQGQCKVRDKLIGILKVKEILRRRG